MAELDTLAELAERLAAEAGVVIMKWYAADDPGMRSKADASPITEADLAAHALIRRGLESATPDIPVLSEEGRHAPAEERARWQRCWLVDPLDGTKEFLAGNGEFTVNIALIEAGQPLLGVVGVPARGEVHVGVVPTGRADTLHVDDGSRTVLSPRPCDENAPVIVVSRSHRGPEQEALVSQLRQQFPGLQEHLAGSALKLVELAAGRADGYPRRGPCMEWDIAAGEAVLLAAGGDLRAFSGSRLRYNKPDSLLNPDFWAVGDPDGALAEALRSLQP
ncbi:MAG: 3'(2'),5'-bisphosphate nucleotidase CysQ [Gammaproteobacteria bacterium]|nr:3'(2'),5'-bisphosphate nucleotidase CysQ [Gammaproteobacteria bacterium]